MHTFQIGLIAVSLLVGSTISYAERTIETPPKVKNVILMIGDGMGVAHVSATMLYHNEAPLNMERAHGVGLVKTRSANNMVTDSAAAATALATGTKTNNGMIGVDADGNVLSNLVELSEKKGLSTGLVVTSAVTHATPAGFVAHVPHRSQEEKIAEAFVKSGLEVFIGGGQKFFSNRRDKQDLTKALSEYGYTVAFNQDDVQKHKKGKLCALLAPNQMPYCSDGRGDYLAASTQKALDILSGENAKGFFLMVEGSLIDYAGHDNNIDRIVSETKDFDQAVKVAFDFADKHPDTLVIVTADHGTGGLSIISNSKNFTDSEKGLKYTFGTTSHSAEMVPLFAYGKGAKWFSGVWDNTDIPKMIAQVLGLREKSK